MRTDRYAYTSSLGAVGLAAVASGAGLLLPGLYRDNDLVTAAWLGNDAVTLLVAVPVLAAALVLARRGSRRARLIWLGMLLYMLYNFQFYLFGAGFNALFLAYAAIFFLAAAGLVFGLAGLDPRTLAARVRPGVSDRGVAAWMMTVAVLLGGFWVSLSVRYWITGEVPGMVEATSHPTNVTGALDLIMVVGLGLLAAAWLWRRTTWGYVLAVIWNVKGAAYMLALSMASVTAWRTGPAADITQLALWVPIGAGCLVSAWVLLRRLDDRPLSRRVTARLRKGMAHAGTTRKG
jgi:hypothetical protein